MNLNNNPMLYPKECGFNPLKAIIERLNALEALVENNKDSLEIKELNVTEDAQIENLNATNGNIGTLESSEATISSLNSTNINGTSIKASGLPTKEAVLSNSFLGFNNEGELIPILPIDSPLYFDYTVNSQQKFDDLIAVLKSENPSIYRSIAVLGGFGAGENGEYLYTINSDSGEADLNNAKIIGFNNPKIVITADDADTFKVFKNGTLKDIEFVVGGTVLDNETVTLFHNCTYNNGKIALNGVSANFNIVNSTLSNVVNDECKSFSGCTLNDFTNNAETAFVSCNLNKGSVNDSCTFTSCELKDYTINGNGTFTSCNFTDGSVNGICTFTSCDLNNILIDYACTFNTSALKDCKNTKYSTFEGCSLNFCDTVQSVFDKCDSEMLYVSTDANIENKYSFNKCGIHLDMRKSDMAQIETVTLDVASLTDSRISVLDDSSTLKKIVLNVDASDSLSEIIGNNDKKYSIYESFVRKIYKSISPSMRSKAYLCLQDESHTPIFSDNGSTFYIDEEMTKEIRVYAVMVSGSMIKGFATSVDSYSTIYSSLKFGKKLSSSSPIPSTISVIKLSDVCDDFILNGTSVKKYISMDDESGTILYSNNNGSTLYLNPSLSNNYLVKYGKDPDNGNALIFLLDTLSLAGKTLNAFNDDYSMFSQLTTQLLEVNIPKDNYAVQVVSDYDVPLYVEKAFHTKIKNN